MSGFELTLVRFSLVLIRPRLRWRCGSGKRVIRRITFCAERGGGDAGERREVARMQREAKGSDSEYVVLRLLIQTQAGAGWHSHRAVCTRRRDTAVLRSPEGVRRRYRAALLRN